MGGMSHTCRRSHKRTVLRTPDPLSRRTREDVEREPLLYQSGEKVATLVLPVIGGWSLEVPICEQCADLPAACPWHREVCCFPLLFLSLCQSKICHPLEGTAGEWHGACSSWPKYMPMATRPWHRS